MSVIAELPEKPAVEVAPPSPKLPGEEAASFLDSLNGDRGERRKPAPAPEIPDEEKEKAEKEAADKAKAEKDAKAKAAAVPKKKTTAPPAPSAPEPDYEKIAEAAGRGVAAAIQKTESDKQSESNPLADLDDDDRERHAAYVQMEKDYPQHYNGLGKKFIDSIKAADEWEAQWLKDHPGEALDENGAEYKAQEEKLSIDYDDLHFQKALARLEFERLMKSQREQSKSEVEGLKLKEREREAEPRIMASRVAAARNYFEALGEDFKDVLDASGNINREAIGKLVESNPLQQIALTTAEGVEQFAHELQSKVETFAHEIRELASNPKSFNSNNVGHLEISEFVAANENHLASLALDKQSTFLDALPDRLRTGRNGKRFATAAQYAALPESKRGQYFRLNSDDMAYLYSVEQGEIAKSYAVSRAESAKKAIAAEENRIDELAKKRGYKKVDAISQATTDTAATAPKPTPTTPLPPSPSGAIEPRQALPPGGALPPKKNAADSFTAQWLG